MSDTDQILGRLQRQIEHFKTNQRIYEQKLQEINESRLKLADQIDHLELDYQKKIKLMQTKMNRLMNQNSTLLKQNQIYQVEVQNFHSRLLEKQKLISMLISQQNQRVPLCDKSRSQLQDEKQEQDDQKQRQFKKSHNNSKAKIFQQDYDHQDNNLQNNISISNPPPPRITATTPSQKIKQKEALEIPSQQKNKQTKLSVPIPTKRNPIKYTIQPSQITQNRQTYQLQKEQIVNSQGNQIDKNKHDFLEHFDLPIQRQQQQSNNDFLNHFQLSQPKQQFSSVNFFQNLKQQNPIINPDVQESSIDHYESSVISSAVNVFTQTNELIQPPKKMPKKKAKRDQIKVVDPSSFE